MYIYIYIYIYIHIYDKNEFHQVRMPDGRVLLLVKGADACVMPFIDRAASPAYATTQVLSLSLSLSLSHTHSLSHAHSLSHTHTHSHTRTNTLPVCLHRPRRLSAFATTPAYQIARFRPLICTGARRNLATHGTHQGE